MADYKLKIRRFDPESGEPAYWGDYDVDLRRSARCSTGSSRSRTARTGRSASAAPAAPRSAARAACASTASRALACNTRIGEAAERAPRRRDHRRADGQHARDQGPDHRHGGGALEEGPAGRALAAPRRGAPEEREYIVPAEAMLDVTQAMACIHCGACVSACLSMEVDPEFVGPAALAKAYRFVGDPRDGATRSACATSPTTRTASTTAPTASPASRSARRTWRR